MRSWSLLAAALALGLAAGCADSPPDDAAGGSTSSAATSSEPSSAPSTTPPAADDPGTMSVQVFFTRMDDGSGSCSEVEAVTREVPETEAVATAALTELFAGPTAEEEQRGLSSLFDAGTHDLLRSLHVADGVAYLDLDGAFLELGNASSSCGGSAVMSSIEATLEQFPTVDEVRYAVEGEPAAFYDFLQIGCPTPSAAGDRCDPEPFRH